MESTNKQYINTFHNQLGHPNERITKETARNMDVNITGKMNVCESCALAKIKHTKISKKDENKSIKPGERIHVDVSYVSTSSLGGK